MKRIISGKAYDTEKAALIGSHERGYPGDLHHVFEGLYLTGRGNYFLHCAGGAASPYGETCGNESWGSSRIIPISREQAFEWACGALSAEDVEKAFPDMIEEA